MRQQQAGGARVRDAKTFRHVGVGAEAQVQPPRAIERAGHGASRDRKNHELGGGERVHSDAGHVGGPICMA